MSLRRYLLASAAAALLLQACSPDSQSPPSPSPQEAEAIPATLGTIVTVDPSGLHQDITPPRSTRAPAPPTQTPTPIPTPIFEWPATYEDMDVLARLDYVLATLGDPDLILYRNSGLGTAMDYGADFSNRVSFETRLVYTAEAVDFEIESHPEFTSSGRFTGKARLCLVYTVEEDPHYWYYSTLWDQQSSIPQKEVLYRDLSEATGLSPSSLLDRLRSPGNCLDVPVSLPHYVHKDSDATRLADFTRPPPDCRPPCWNGFTPGNSSPSEINPFFERLGVSAEDIKSTPADTPQLNISSAFFESFPYDFPNLPPAVSVLWDPSRTVSVELSNLDPTFISLEDLVASMGYPDQVYILVAETIQVRYFAVILRYPSRRTSILLTGELVWDEDSQDELLCITDEAGVLMDALFYADSGDVYQDLSLWWDSPTTADDIRDQYLWTSFPRDPTTQPPALEMGVEDISGILATDGACLPPLFH